MTIYHLAHLFAEKAQTKADAVAVRYRDYKVSLWRGLSWSELSWQTDHCAAAMLQAGIQSSDKVGIFSQNKPECLVSECAAYSLRAVAVPMYATSTTAQIEYILRDAGIRLLFVGEQYQYDRAYEALEDRCGLEQIVIFDKEVRLNRNDSRSVYFSDFIDLGQRNGRQPQVEAIRQQCEFSDVANILYTSGTTGNPKGVVLLHSNFREIFRVMNLKLDGIIGDNQSSLSFLPLTHILEKAWAYYSLENDIRVDVNLKPRDVQMAIKETRPSMMCAVPRFWEKVYTGIQEAIQSYSLPKRKFIQLALRIGSRYNLGYLRNEREAPHWLKLAYSFLEDIVFDKVKRTVGIENGRLFPTAGAKLSDDICRFMRSIGIPLCYGYGLTESCATVACFDQTKYDFGSVGTPVDGLQVRISPEGEVLLKGDTITPGYYNRPDVNAEAFTPDGFFRTGDGGYLNEHGQLVLTERLKDLFKTSNGKYIAPQTIEAALCSDRYIEEAAVVGDQRKFVSALIIPAYEEIPALMQQLGITDVPSDNMAACLSHPSLINFFEGRIREIQKDMAAFEQIRRFILLPEPFSMEKGELTNTLKVKRNVVIAHHLDEINALYEEL